MTGKGCLKGEEMQKMEAASLGELKWVLNAFFFFLTVEGLNTWQDKQSTAKSQGALWPWSTCLLWGEGRSVILTSKKVRVKSKGAVADFKRTMLKQCSFSP